MVAAMRGWSVEIAAHVKAVGIKRSLTPTLLLTHSGLYISEINISYCTCMFKEYRLPSAASRPCSSVSVAPQCVDVAVVFEDLSVAPPHQSSPLFEGQYMYVYNYTCTCRVSWVRVPPEAAHFF